MAQSLYHPALMTEKWWLREGASPKTFRYVAPNGRVLTAEKSLARIRKLAIPPGWTDVHVSPDPQRKVQAWGIDAAGRKQYRYHPAFREKRDRRKWQRVLATAQAL